MKNFYLILLSLIVFTNCQKENINDDNIELTHPNNEILTVREISLDDAYQILPEIQELKNPKTKNNKTDSTNGIEIISNEVTVISDGINEFYTFQIQRAETTLIENLIIKSSKLTNQNNKKYTTFIATYDLSPSEKISLEKGIDIDLDEKVNIQPILLNENNNAINQRPERRCFQTVMIDQNGKEISRATGWDLKTRPYYVLVEITCPYVPSSVDVNNSQPKDYNSNNNNPVKPSGGGGQNSGIHTTPNMSSYGEQLRTFENHVLGPIERKYYHSSLDIKNIVNTFLKQNNFSEFSQNEVKTLLSFGFTQQLNVEQFYWALENFYSSDMEDIKKDVAEAPAQSRTIVKMKIDANRAKSGWDFNRKGTLANRPSLKFKAIFEPNPGEKMFFLDNGLVLYQSSTKRIINIAQPNTIPSSEVVTDGYNYIYNYDTKTWFEYRMPPATYQDADIDFLIQGFWDGAVIVGRYASPLEDAIILIDGKDFDGVEQNKVASAGFMIVGIIPGGKITKAFKPIARVIKGSDIARDSWKIIAKTGNKTITLSFKVVNGLVDFGSRSKLAKIINTTTFEEAHHILPWNKLNNEVIQEAAYAGFHMNSKVNGKALKKYTSLTGEGLHGNHPAYDKYVQKRLDDFANNNFDSNRAKDFLEKNLIPKLDELIELAKNSNLNLNEYFKRVVNPPIGL